MTEAMAIAVVHNLAIELGEIDANPVTATLEAICLADFGDRGIVFVADPVLPNPITGKRRRAIALEGRWVSWSKSLFELFFLAKMRWGVAVPFFEAWLLEAFGLNLTEAIEPNALAPGDFNSCFAEKYQSSCEISTSHPQRNEV